MAGEWAEGWYPDPFERFRTRWWDGSQWTGYAADTAVEWDEEPLAIEDDRPRVPALPGLRAAGVGYVTGLVLASVAAVLLSRAGEPGGRAVLLGASSLGLWAGLVGACVYVSRRRGTGRVFRDFGWRLRRLDIGLGVAGWIAARIASAVVIVPIPMPADRLPAPEQPVFEEVAGAAGWLVLIVVVGIGAPVVEELFFRGLVQTRLVAAIGPVAGIGVTSVLFGAAHLGAWTGPETLIYAWGIAGAGVVLGTLRHLAGLGAATAAHAVFNLQAVVVIALFV